MVDYTVKEILAQRPAVFLLENVCAFTRAENGHARTELLNAVRADGLFTLFENVVCTSRAGLPQTRKRWYVAGLLSSALSLPFTWPTGVEQLPLDALLGPHLSIDSGTRNPAGGQLNAQHNVTMWMRSL